MWENGGAQLLVWAGLGSSLQKVIEDWRDINTKDAWERHKAALFYIYLKFHRLHKSLSPTQIIDTWFKWSYITWQDNTSSKNHRLTKHTSTKHEKLIFKLLERGVQNIFKTIKSVIPQEIEGKSLFLKTPCIWGTGFELELTRMHPFWQLASIVLGGDMHNGKVERLQAVLRRSGGSEPQWPAWQDIPKNARVELILWGWPKNI